MKFTKRDIEDFKEIGLVIGGLLLLIIVFILVPVGLADYLVGRSACSEVCTTNGDTPRYIWTGGGCWCEDEKGLYNPADSRNDAGEAER